MMRSPKLNAEKITHPIQLMAAWFVMLILLVSLLLAAAAKINNPPWIPGFLVISSIAISLVVMFAVFAMLTRFRPHLQDSKEYASWLKDERRFSFESVGRIEVRELPPKSPDSLSIVQTTTSLELSSSNDSPLIMEICNMRRADEVLRALKSHGFLANIYTSDFEDDLGQKTSLRLQAAIWIGSDIAPNVAVATIKIVSKIWPHLCYLHLSSDSNGPDYIHEQMFFGGTTSTAVQYGLRRWTKTEIEQIPDELTKGTWHAIVRAKYGQPAISSQED